MEVYVCQWSFQTCSHAVKTQCAKGQEPSETAADGCACAEYGGLIHECDTADTLVHKGLGQGVPLCFLGSYQYPSIQLTIFHFSMEHCFVVILWMDEFHFRIT